MIESQFPFTAEEEGAKYMESFNVKSLEDFRKIPAEELLKILAAQPSKSGWISITKIYFRNICRWRRKPVDLLTGWNEDDGFPLARRTMRKNLKTCGRKIWN